MKRLLLFSLLLWGGVAVAQCPVEFVNVNPQAGCSPNTCFAIQVKNSSEKTIVGASYRLVLLDAVGTEHELHTNYQDGGKVVPGKVVKAKWEINFERKYYNATDKGYAYLRKVLFSDGSTWEDDESHSCKGEKR